MLCRCRFSRREQCSANAARATRQVVAQVLACVYEAGRSLAGAPAAPTRMNPPSLARMGLNVFDGHWLVRWHRGSADSYGADDEDTAGPNCPILSNKYMVKVVPPGRTSRNGKLERLPKPPINTNGRGTLRYNSNSTTTSHDRLQSTFDTLSTATARTSRCAKFATRWEITHAIANLGRRAN